MKQLFFTTLLFLNYCYINAQTKEIIREWVSFEKKIAVETDKKVNFKIKARIKTKGLRSNSAAYLWATVDNKEGEESGTFVSTMDTLQQSDTWTPYEIKGSFDQRGETLYFGGYVVSDGDFYFDDYHVYFQEEGQEFSEINISNPGFEKLVTEDQIPDWEQDTDKKDTILKVKGYRFFSAETTDYGKRALHIKGRDVQKSPSNYIQAEEGFSPQIGVLISMLNNLSNRVERVVKDLDMRQTDHLLDEKANRIGALIMHLAAAEKIYQNLTFEHREFNEQEEKEWMAGLELGEKAREKFKGKPISYYLDIYKKTRQETITQLKKRNDTWLEESWPGATMNNHFAWFHVMEHQSSHLGQILMLKKRIPEEKQPDPTLEKKVD